VRREAHGIRRYCHLSTGNYHPGTARLYTDYGLFTCDEAVGNDVHEIFLQLTSLTQTPRLRRLLQSPFKMHETLHSLIGREITNARAGKGGRIIAKINALVDPQIIECLYRASGAGVRVDLIVRGVCALRPGLPGVSENIQVRSIVGRFLEHSRVYWFENNGRPHLYLSSADWMERNFFRRIEVAFPIMLAKLRTRIRDDLEHYLTDTCNSWLLQSDGSYLRATGTPRIDVQEQLLDAYAAAVRLPE
jgi:polyphosphate kinase